MQEVLQIKLELSPLDLKFLASVPTHVARA